MSAAVERSTPIIPAVRSADEVIDVDAFVERPAQRRRIGRTASSREEPIIIGDSDDDDDEIVFVSELPRRRLSGGRLASLPPPPQDNIIPPLPPFRRNFHTGHIQPNPEPLDFEEEFFAPRHYPRQPSPILPPPPRSAPRSHHQPALGFGGALIAANRRQQQQQSDGTLARLLDFPRRFIFRLPFFGQGVENEEEDDRLFLNFAMGLPHDEDLFHLRQPRPAAPDYKPEYTHPKPPPPGFTHDFEPSVTVPSATVEDPIVIDEDDTEPNATPTATLACACCLDPLVLTAEMTDSEQVKLKKLWGLRCGHVLDSKCVLDLMCPSSAEEEEVASLPVKVDIKGKGKAVDPLSDELNIRSRLRSNHPLQSTSSATTVKKRKSRGRKTKAKSVVEGRFEWACPVKGCARIHTSLKIDGEWVPDKEKGPIGLFV